MTLLGPGAGDINNNNSVGAHAVEQARDVAYYAASNARRYVVCQQATFGGVTGGTAFSATAPILILVGGAAVSTIVRRLRLSQVGTVAGGFIRYIVAIDTANRYSSGGSIVTPQNQKAGGAASTATQSRDGTVAIVATAAGGGTEYVRTEGAAASVGSTVELDFKDGIVLGVSMSLLVYAFAAVTGPTVLYELELEEVA